MSRLTTVSVVLLSLATTGLAMANDGDDHRDDHRYDHRWHKNGDPPMTTPEIDPSQGTAALALLAGAVAIVRGRRKKK
jgi:hypothetical protein